MAKNRIDRKGYQGVQFGINPVQVKKVEITNTSCEPNVSSIDTKTNQPGQAVAPTFEQIEERARMIWMQRGCIPGEDERNWNEAETQLRAEIHIV